MGIQTLDRKRKLWGLQQRNLPQSPAPIVQASIRSSHCKGLDLNEMKAQLLKETGRDVAIRTIQRYLKFLNLKQIENDLQNGKTTIEKVVECINHARTELLQTSAGYRSMHRILKQFYAISLPRNLVYEILQEIDPEGLAQRLRKTCKRPKAGGIPLKVTTDYGSETIDMAAQQMFLSHHYAGISVEEAKLRHHFTKSTRNQKIEALWSQMMKQHNQAVIDIIQNQIESGKYNPEDEVQK
ncbi:hypothetical protein PTTG_07270 [Puccinia triticina 1-1 BBBD Race 1]|uniref:F-box domain-containing protein n=1 Tax=Puccinia triticina (isolate 1-1 / race 1 (BBBD)) TaxID=630390 RepID=A0A0C4F2E9_PUCT1|nr:hypothetical protein PTTG_07270 [Puccinia triticina 1-1 BBBD Race 1]